MTRALTVLARRIADALRDLAPIILVIAFFQIVVLQQPFPNLGSILVGLVCVIAGLTLFIQGLESGLFPLGVLCILKGWPIHRLIIAGYVLVTFMTVFAPDEIN